MFLKYYITLACTSLVVVSAQICRLYGGPSCCPPLDPLPSATESVDYVTFLPRSVDSERLDNMCYTRYPVPDSDSTYILYASRVYTDGTNLVESFIVNDIDPGVSQVANAQCIRVDITFGAVQRDDLENCNTFLSYRCPTSGECKFTDLYTDVPAPVLGVSPDRRPMGRACLAEANSIISDNGLPVQDFYILPMRLPSQCVFHQASAVRPARQQFQHVAQYPATFG